MRINIVKNYTLKVFDKINEKREEYIDKKKYMLFYLICYDFIFIIFIYIFIFGGFKSGIVKIIFQVFKIYSTAKRLKMSNPFLIILKMFGSGIGHYSLLKDFKFLNFCSIS